MSQDITYRYSSENGKVYQLDANNNYIDVTDSISQAELAIIKKNSAGKGGGLDRISHQEVERQLNAQREAVAKKEAEMAAARQKEIDRVTAARKTAEEERNNKEFMTTSDNNVAESCAVCKGSGLQCLCEVILKVEKSSDGSSEEYYWHSQKKGRKKLPKVVVASGHKAITGLKGAETKSNFQLIGGCNYGSQGKCVEAELTTLSINNNNKYHYDREHVGKKGDIELTYDKNLKLYADISSNSIDIYPIEQPYATLIPGITVPGEIEFFRAVDFLLLGKLYNFPVNYRLLKVAECDTQKNINPEITSVHFLSTPLYEVEFDFSLSFDGEEVDDDVAESFKKELLSPDEARYGRFTTKAKLEIKLDRVKVEADFPIPDLTTMPVMNKVTTVLHKMDQMKGYGDKATGVSKVSYPLAFSIHPPVAHLKAKASFTGGGDQVIERSGTFNLDPIIGFSMQIDIFSLLTKVGGALGKAIDKGVDNKFSEVVKVKSMEARKKIIIGESMSTGIRAAAFFYFDGKIDFIGEIGLTPSKLGELKLPFKEPKLGAKIKFGLYAGVYAEARLWGFGGSFGAGIEISTEWEGYYYFDEGGIKFWHNGIFVKVYIEAEFGQESSKNGNDYGSLNEAPKIETKVDWSGMLMAGGSADNPWFDTTEPKKLSEDNSNSKNIVINIKEAKNKEIKDESQNGGGGV